jgi:hypothetical protein
MLTWIIPLSDVVTSMPFNFRKRARRSTRPHKWCRDRFESSFPLIDNGTFGWYIGDFSVGQWYKLVLYWHCYVLPMHGQCIRRHLDVNNDDGKSWLMSFISLALFAQ